MNLEGVTVVLVGLCNGDPLMQTLIGTIVFREGEEGKLEPRLIDIQVENDVGTPGNPYKPNLE